MTAKPTLRDPGTILDLLTHNASHYAQAPALLAPRRAPLNNELLLRNVEENIAVLMTAGIRPGDPVIVVLDNGPEMAVAFLSTAAFCACAPLNPGYKALEFDAAFYALRPSAVIASGSTLQIVTEIASKHGAAVFESVPDYGREAGICALKGHSPVRLQGDPPLPGIALLLQTSGTTARPKLVGLTQSNLMSSTENIRRSLELGPTDRCLNIMPLFHIHGLVGALLASLRAGASVICSPGFRASWFFDWLTEFWPTWYTAVPTMHASIVARAAHSADTPLPHSLRFIRSCSAALPTRLMNELQEIFGVPVLEAYGMTEASHQIACNPLPPHQQKPGSVGVPTGTEIAILDEIGRCLPLGAEGEIAVQGASVIRGYLENAPANTQSFTNGWFRTGDLGSIDVDGYVFIKGRLKEIINRGGSKISPYEIEEVLLGHPGVAEAAVFAIPDDRLGEHIGAAVVLKAPSSVTAAEIREFLSLRLADFKIPQRIVFVDEIPKGPTGKLQRMNLSSALARGSSVSNTAGEIDSQQSSRVEELLLSVWATALRLDHIALSDNFFELAGDSVSATEMLLRIEQLTGVRLPIGSLFEAPTVRDLTRRIVSPGSTPLAQRVFPINGQGSRPPFFLVEAGPRFWPLSQRLGNDQPVYSIIDPAEQPSYAKSIEELAAFHIRSIRVVQAEGPYFIGGWCADGITAYEIAQQLRSQGQEVSLLVLFDSLNPSRWDKYPVLLVPLLQALDLVQTSWFHFRAMRGLRVGDCLTYARERLATLLLKLRRSILLLRSYIDHSVVERRHLSSELVHVVVLRYRPQPYSGSVVLFRRILRPLGPGQDQALGWADVVGEGLTVVNVPGDHVDMFLEPQVRGVAENLSMLMRGLA